MEFKVTSSGGSDYLGSDITIDAATKNLAVETSAPFNKRTLLLEAFFPSGSECEIIDKM